MKYESKVTAIGDCAFELLKTCNSIIIFDNNAPKELAEISVLHTIENLREDIKVGDKLVLGKQTYNVTAVGEEAMHTLREMGHCTLKFTGKEVADLPGQIELSGPSELILEVGDIIAFS